jgi:putative copper export protein
MDIAELVLLLIVLSSAFAVIYVPYSAWMTWNAKKVTNEIKTSRVATVFIAALGLLALSNALSGEWVSGLNAIIWLLAIGPVVASVYFLLHATRLFRKDKKLSSAQRRFSLVYIVLVLTVVLAALLYPMAQDWNDERNEKDYQRGLRQTCQLIDATNRADCTRNTDAAERAAQERLDTATGN